MLSYIRDMLSTRISLSNHTQSPCTFDFAGFLIIMSAEASQCGRRLRQWPSDESGSMPPRRFCSEPSAGQPCSGIEWKQEKKLAISRQSDNFELLEELLAEAAEAEAALAAAPHAVVPCRKAGCGCFCRRCGGPEGPECPVGLFRPVAPVIPGTPPDPASPFHPAVPR